MFETTIRDGVFQAEHETTRWLSSGWDGGRSAGHSVTVHSRTSSRYPDGEYPETLADAEYGVRTTVAPTVFTP